MFQSHKASWFYHFFIGKMCNLKDFFKVITIRRFPFSIYFLLSIINFFVNFFFMTLRSQLFHFVFLILFSPCFKVLLFILQAFFYDLIYFCILYHHLCWLCLKKNNFLFLFHILLIIIFSYFFYIYIY
jgi:hypothetical protein